ncbi:MAG: 6-carboxytetrahydropterin synthase [Sphingobacteriales bacterium]|jgi:6-pyruvoyltetrahydropterin/6-carboxytetrahydropterin synthase|nr:6-carboxytetrahydropterin synthase [Sphingobacteriales bacterium]
MVFITRRERFNSAHKLARPDWDDQRNAEVFGKCANPNWHGHNYELFVTVKGELNPDTGFVIDLKFLSNLIKDKVVEKLDHRNINLEVDFMQGKLASTEILAIAIWDQLADAIREKGCELHCVKLYETENNYAEYFG